MSRPRTNGFGGTYEALDKAKRKSFTLKKTTLEEKVFRSRFSYFYSELI